MKLQRTLAALSAAVLLAGAALLSACSQTSKVDLSAAKTIADLKGAKISAQSGTFHENARQQIEDVQGSLYEDFDSMLIALKSGAIDGYIAEEPTALDVCGKNQDLAYIPLKNNDTGFTATDADTAIAVGCKKGSELIERMNGVLSGITDEQKSALMEQIIAANNGESITSYAVSNEPTGGDGGTLKVAMECAYAPYNWTQQTDANGAVAISSEGSAGLYANGYDVQIAKYIANALGMKLEIYAEKWESLVSGVQAGTYDAIIAGMSPTSERAEQIDFTIPYYVSNLVVIYKK
mgnify:FL=1